MKTNDEIVEEFRKRFTVPNDTEKMSTETVINELITPATYEAWLRTILTQKDAEVAERINKEMALHTPALTAKKPKAYNEGLLSGWYAARAFIKTLTPNHQD